MPIIGVIDSSKSGNLYSSSFDSIMTTTVSSPVTTVTLSNIPQTYQHLQLRVVCRGSLAGSSNALVTFNGDTTAANYPLHYTFGEGASVATGYSPTDGGILISRVPGTSFASGIFGLGITDIYDYTNTNKFKTLRSINGQESNGAGNIQFVSGFWNNTNAITSMRFAVAGGHDFTANTTFALYGIKGV